MKKTVAKNEAFDVHWQASRTVHTVTYGKHQKKFIGRNRDIEAAHEYGLCIRHAAECEGLLCMQREW